MSRASTPVDSTPAPAVQAPSPAAATPATPHTLPITITPPATPVTTEGQKPAPVVNKTAKIAEALASRIAAREPVDAEDADSQSDDATEARTTPLGQAAAPAKPDTSDAAPEPSAREKNAARIRESLKAQAAAREAEQARRASQPPAHAQPPAAPQRAWSPDDVLDALARDERGAIEQMRARGWDNARISKLLDTLTNEALSQDSRKAVVQATQAEERAKQAEERTRRVEQHIVSREQEQYAQQEARQFHQIATAKEGEDHLYPTLAGLPEQKRYEFAMWFAERKPPGTFTLESLALDLEEELASLLPKPATPPPASPPASPTTPAATSKKTTRAALPPDLVGESGKTTTKPRTEKERTAAITARLARSIRTRDRQQER